MECSSWMHGLQQNDIGWPGKMWTMRGREFASSSHADVDGHTCTYSDLINEALHAS